MQIVERGIINQGEPGTKRAVSSFPSITSLDNGSVLATYRVGPKKDSEEEIIEVRRSLDNGSTWGRPIAPFSSMVDGKRGSLITVLVTPLSENHLIAVALWVNREAYPGKPVFNPETEGCLPMAILLADSKDRGQSWTPWRVMPMPEEIGPPSLTNSILRLPSGRLALSIETNKNYEDRSKWYQRVVYFYSEDRGKTWSRPITVSQDPTGRIFNWDQRAGIAPDGRLVTFTMTYDHDNASYLNIHRRLSSDEGKTWTPPQDLGIAEQASHPAMLPDGRVVLAWVDRYKRRSILARLSNRVDGPFLPETELLLYEGERKPLSRAAGGLDTADTGDVLLEQISWTYGLPYAEVLPDRKVMVVFYAGTETRMDIQWAKLVV